MKRFHDHVEGTGLGLYIVKRILENASWKMQEGKLKVKKGRGLFLKFILKPEFALRTEIIKIIYKNFLT